jgi:hypothetical protein
MSVDWQSWANAVLTWVAVLLVCTFLYAVYLFNVLIKHVAALDTINAHVHQLGVELRNYLYESRRSKEKLQRDTSVPNLSDIQSALVSMSSTLERIDSKLPKSGSET